MSRKFSHIRIDRVAMTGPDKPTVDVRFFDGVNIVWGASNAGKSFIRKSIDYVFGGEKVDIPKEGIGYDNFIVWLTVPEAGQVSLRRSVHGGDIYLAREHSETVDQKSHGYDTLKWMHVQSPNISKFILQESGFREARLLKNERAEKSPFSLRLLIRYLIVDETRMIDQKSILLHHHVTVTSEDKGLIKFLLTGIDGSSVEQVRSGGELKAAREGKIELLSKLAEQIRSRIDGERSDDEVEEALSVSKLERDNLQPVLNERQEALDALSASVNAETAALLVEETEIAEISAMIVRFEELMSIFLSDLSRLSGLEEGNFLLQKFARISCPVCGAAPEHQEHDHGLGDMEIHRIAAEAEIAKIRRDRTELLHTILDANSEQQLRLKEVDAILSRRLEAQQNLDEAKLLETSARSVFSAAVERVQKLEADANNRRLLASYDSEISQISSQPVQSRQRAVGLDLNLNLTSSEANELCKVIKQVLKAWNYPGGEAVHFDPQEQDIVVDGNHRRNNGAGIRAILHAAFKVALLVYCKNTGRPHPGFLVLDSPLLAYRPADETNDLGELTEQELALQKADLASHFYAHLHSFQDRAQFIVIENHKSDQEVVEPYPNTRFTRNSSLGRVGFFE